MGDCVSLIVEHGSVFTEHTGEFVGRREVAPLDRAGLRWVPANEAPIGYAKTGRGWVAVLSAFVPEEFDFDAPELRMYVFDPLGKRDLVSDNYNLLGSFNVGRIFPGDAEFVQISSTGAHSYVVLTRIWLLPPGGSPRLLVDVPGLLTGIQRPAQGQPAGFWIAVQTYDGVNAGTKGEKLEFWAWDPNLRTLTLVPDPGNMIRRAPQVLP